MKYIIQQGAFVIKHRYAKRLICFFRKLRYSFLGLKIGRNSKISKIYITWPHQVKIGSDCNIEHGIFFKFDGIWKSGPSILIGNSVFIGCGCEFNIRKGISIGNDCLLASGCKFVDHDHGIATNQLMRLQGGAESAIIIGNNVWLGFNVLVLKGVHIGEGAIVAAGAVVTRSIPAGEIWAGIPAKKVGNRKM